MKRFSIHLRVYLQCMCWQRTRIGERGLRIGQAECTFQYVETWAKIRNVAISSLCGTHCGRMLRFARPALLCSAFPGCNWFKYCENHSSKLREDHSLRDGHYGASRFTYTAFRLASQPEGTWGSP